MSDTVSRAQTYLNQMVSERGYVLEYHKVMAAHDLDVLEAANTLVSAAYLTPRELDRLTKEYIFVTSLTVLRAPLDQIEAHIRIALARGATPQQILEAIEIALPEAGVVAFQHGFSAWCNVVGAEGLEPDVDLPQVRAEHP